MGLRCVGLLVVRQDRAVQVGLTGGIGSGKTAASDLLAELGAVVIDADDVAREVVEPGTDGLAAIVAEFGPDVLTGTGALDREALAAVVFTDPAARERLNAIVHPRVRERAAALAAAAPDGAVVVQVIPLLVEVGMAGAFDLVVVVDVPPEVQLDRLVRSRGMGRAEAEARVAAQAGREERLAAADVVLDNSGPPEQLADQVRELWGRLTRPV